MINQKECMPLILLALPEFEQDWNAHLKFWEGETAGLSNDVSRFSNYIIENMARFCEKELISVFDLAEKLLTDGDTVVRDAIATCFLENLLNAHSDNRLQSEKFAPFLREKSRCYCKAWDEFTGVRTAGLW